MCHSPIRNPSNTRIRGHYPLRVTNLEYINPLISKRKDVASFLKFPKYEECRGKMYESKISTKNNFYNKTVYMNKCSSIELPIIIYWPNLFILKYWVKTLIVEEGPNIILKCVYGNYKFAGNKLWCIRVQMRL